MSFDREQYGKLLAEFQPRIIESVEEHEQMLTAAEQLMEKGERLTLEEKKVLALLVLLIDAFEAAEDDDDDRAPVELPKPFETLRRLMEARSLSLHDIADVFGNPVAAQEALEGKRPISRGQAKQLSNYFRVPVKLFQA